MDELSVKIQSYKCASCVTKPCQVGCPLNNDITEFIRLVRLDKYKEAYEVLSNTTVLSSVCGRICPHERQCQNSCARKLSYGSIKIGEIESFIGDKAIENDWSLPKPIIEHKEKIAIIGSGPASLTCAGFLREKGYQVDIYEKHSYLGGLLYHGIPEFRLNKDLLNKTIKKILDLGINVNLNNEIGKDIQLEDLVNQYDAVFLGIGANISTKMNIPGEELKGVYGGNELLENNTHPNYAGKKVAVIGGGNVAMDTARTIKRLGAYVTIIYRRSEKEMPAESKEIREAKEEGIEFLFRTNIKRIIGYKEVKQIECIKTELVKKDNDTRLSPVDIPDSNFILDMDYVVMAIGSKAESNTLKKLNLELTDRGYLKVNNNQTSNEKVFAGGDLVGEKSTVAFASRSGRNAANSIIRYLGGDV